MAAKNKDAKVIKIPLKRDHLKNSLSTDLGLKLYLDDLNEIEKLIANCLNKDARKGKMSK